MSHRSGSSPRTRRASRRSRRRGCHRQWTAGGPHTFISSPQRRPSSAGSARNAGAIWVRSQAREGRTPLGLDGVESGGRGDYPRPAPRQAANAPPPTCTKIRSSERSVRSPISHPIVRPPSRATAFSGPCTVNGIDPAATAPRKRTWRGRPARRPNDARNGAPTPRAGRVPSRSRGSSRWARRRRSANRRRLRALPPRPWRCRTTRSPAEVVRRGDRSSRRPTGAAGW